MPAAAPVIQLLLIVQGKPDAQSPVSRTAR